MPSSDVVNTQEFIGFAHELIIETKPQYCEVKVMNPSQSPRVGFKWPMAGTYNVEK